MDVARMHAKNEIVRERWKSRFEEQAAHQCEREKDRQSNLGKNGPSLLDVDGYPARRRKCGSATDGLAVQNRKNLSIPHGSYAPPRVRPRRPGRRSCLSDWSPIRRCQSAQIEIARQADRAFFVALCSTASSSIRPLSMSPANGNGCCCCCI